jgi:hypothetical protein
VEPKVAALGMEEGACLVLEAVMRSGLLVGAERSWAARRISVVSVELRLPAELAEIVRWVGTVEQVALVVVFEGEG